MIMMTEQMTLEHDYCSEGSDSSGDDSDLEIPGHIHDESSDSSDSEMIHNVDEDDDEGSDNLI